MFNERDEKMSVAQEDVFKLIAALVDCKQSKSFVDGYEATQAESFGILLSQYFKWSGYEIAEVCIEALHDSNFHTLADNFSKCLAEDISNSELAAKKFAEKSKQSI